MNKSPKIGFIGLGLMGTPMSRRLIDAGYQVSVWNRSPEKTKPLSSYGCSVSATVAELVNDCDIIMLCVSDTKAVESLVFGDGGIAAYARPHHILVDFSSIDPKATRIFAEKLAHKTGAKWVDAPVSGGVAGAETSSLVIMAGGDTDVVDSLRPILENLSQRVTHMGAVGSGQATKVCNQILVSCNVLIMAEVLAMAEKAGVDSKKIPEALKGGFADSIPLQLTGTRMVNRDFDEIKWHVKTLQKDLLLAKDMAESIHSYTPMTELAGQLMQKHVDAGLADKDPSILIEPYLNH